MKEMITTQISIKRKLHLKQYLNGQLAVYVHEFNGEPIAELSILNNSVDIAPDEFILKDYSENEHLVEECYESNLFIPTGRYLLIGSHLCPICQIRSEV
jgi:hypothetical protein